MSPDVDWPRGLWCKKLVLWPRITIDNKVLKPFGTGFRRNVYCMEMGLRTEWITPADYVYRKLKGEI